MYCDTSCTGFKWSHSNLVVILNIFLFVAGNHDYMMNEQNIENHIFLCRVAGVNQSLWNIHVLSQSFIVQLDEVVDIPHIHLWVCRLNIQENIIGAVTKPPQHLLLVRLFYRKSNWSVSYFLSATTTENVVWYNSVTKYKHMKCSKFAR